MTRVNEQVEHAGRTGGRMVPLEERTLPLRSVSLRAEARGGICRAVLTQRFENPWPDPLHVVYRMPLPAEGAVSGYAFRIGERRIVGEVDKKVQARQRFEQALLTGHTAALLDEERESLFTQEIGNIPPGAELCAELVIDQPLAWVADEGAWEWRFPTAAAPCYLGAPGRVGDAAQVTIDVADRPLLVRLSLSLQVADALPAEVRPESPSHRLATSEGGRHEGRGAGAHVTFADPGGVALDRDVVVRWRVAVASPGITLCTSGVPAAPPARTEVVRRPVDAAAFGLLTLVPPAPWVRPGQVARDLVVLLDTSGSMMGEPLDQARRVALALVDSLTAGDTLELIAFGSFATRWNPSAVPGDVANRKRARRWLESRSASGGTEMKDGLLAALGPLRQDAQRQVVLITDGQIGFEQEIVATLLERLPSASRLHVVGVGSAVNRGLTRPAARAGRGVEIVIGLGEDGERAARRVLAHTAEPSLVELHVEGDALIDEPGNVVPSCLPDVFGAAPVRLSLRLRPAGGTLVVRGRTVDGPWERTLRVPALDGNGEVGGAAGSGLASLWAREAVSDLELRGCAGEESPAIDGEIERIGLLHQIATRMTSWVAVDEVVSVDPTAPTRRTVVPQALPHGQSIEGLGLRSASPEMNFKIGAHRHIDPRSFPTPTGTRPIRGRRSMERTTEPPEGAGIRREVVDLSEQMADLSAGEIGPPDFRGLLRSITPSPSGGAEILIELEAYAPYPYRTPQQVMLLGRDGTTHTVLLQADRSTGAGPVRGGQRIRLLLLSATPLVGADFDFVELLFADGERLRVEL